MTYDCFNYNIFATVTAAKTHTISVVAYESINVPELYVQGLSFFFFFVGRIVYVHVCQVTSVLIHREKHKSPGRELKLKCLDQS